MRHMTTVLWGVLLGTLGSVTACTGEKEDSTPDSEYDSRVADADSDGLSDYDELNLHGSDPNNADTDGDGYSDGDEVNTLGTSPINAYSHPYVGNYNVGDCATIPTGTGPSASRLAPDGTNYIALYQPGDVVNNFQFKDQYDEPVDLYSFCGRYVSLVFFGLQQTTDWWNAPLLCWLDEWKYVHDYYRDYGFELIIVVTQNASTGQPTTDDLAATAALFGFNDSDGNPASPVLGLPENENTLNGVHSLFESDWHEPTVVHLGPDMSVLSVDQDNCQGADRDPCPYMGDWVPSGLCWENAFDCRKWDKYCVCPAPECTDYCDKECPYVW